MIDRPYTLIEAARAGDLKTVQELLADKKNDIDQHDSNDTTALIAAADCNQINMVNALLIWGADINLADANHMTALMKAAEKGHYEIVFKLLAMKPDIRKVNLQSESVLMLAVKADHLNVVRLLLSYDTNLLYAMDNDNFTPLEYAAANNNLPMARELLAYEEDDSRNITAAVRIAVDHGHVDMVLLLCTANKEIAPMALRMAASKGNAEIVSALLANHVKIDVKNSQGITALMLASEYGHLNVVNLLLAHPEAANTINQTSTFSEQTALMYAKYLPIVRVLLTAGADVNHQDVRGRSALSMSFGKDKKELTLELVKELLIWGSALHKNIDGATPLDYAKVPNQVAALQFMEEHIKERETYEERKKEMKSFFETTNTFFPAPIVSIIVDEYATPTIKVTPAKKQQL